MIDNNFCYISDLQYRNKALKNELERYRSGEKYVQLKQVHRQDMLNQERIITKLRKELAEANRRLVDMRKKWLEVLEDVQEECERTIHEKDKELAAMEKRALDAERKVDELKNKVTQQRHEYHETAGKLEDALELIQKLTAQVNKDFETSSIPSSQQGAGRKRIPNSREASSRKPGGQPGHKGHKRKQHVPDETHALSAPDAVTEHPEDYYKTGNVIRKQKVFLNLGIRVVEYTADEYRSRKTGTRIHAPFPEGYVNEVNYDGTVKAATYLLVNECNTSHDKACRFLEEITGGKLCLSKGMVNSLCKELSSKSKEEQDEMVSRIMNSSVLNVDFTGANVNGDNAQVLILASPSENISLLIGREHKGHAGIQGTPLENYCGTIVHDHDTTFYSYGLRHQECNQHNIRYLKGSIENEPDRQWHTKMLKLLREMIHYRNGLEPGAVISEDVINDFENRYDNILDEAWEEYEDIPPGKYYREGFNLMTRLRNYKENELLFLHDTSVPSSNSLAERMARIYKRKQKQAIAFRSQDSFELLCTCMSMVGSMRANAQNAYNCLTEIFNRPLPKVTEV